MLRFILLTTLFVYIILSMNNPCNFRKQVDINAPSLDSVSITQIDFCNFRSDGKEYIICKVGKYNYLVTEGDIVAREEILIIDIDTIKNEISGTSDKDIKYKYYEIINVNKCFVNAL